MGLEFPKTLERFKIQDENKSIKWFESLGKEKPIDRSKENRHGRWQISFQRRRTKTNQYPIIDVLVFVFFLSERQWNLTRIFQYLVSSIGFKIATP